MLGCLTLNLRGLQSTQIWLAMALPLCGLGGITAMMFAFAEGNTFLATSAGSLAGLVGGTSLVNLPWTGITGSYIGAAEGDILLGTTHFLKVSEEREKNFLPQLLKFSSRSSLLLLSFARHSVSS